MLVGNRCRSLAIRLCQRAAPVCCILRLSPGRAHLTFRLAAASASRAFEQQYPHRNASTGVRSIPYRPSSDGSTSSLIVDIAVSAFRSKGRCDARHHQTDRPLT